MFHSTKLTLAYLYLGSIVAPFIEFFTTYVFNDTTYLIYLAILVGVDTLTGIAKVIFTGGKLSADGFRKLFKKLISYSSALVMSHVLVSFQVHGKNLLVFSWVDTVIFSSIIVAEAFSVVENLDAIMPDLIPAGFKKYLKNFDSFTLKNRDNEKANNDYDSDTNA